MVYEETKSKKQRHDECIINCIPGDLIERIFLSLPVDTLLRCTSVSKHWKNFIRDPQFVTSHLQNAPRYALLFFPQETVSTKLYPSDAILIDDTWSHSTCAVPVIGPDDFLFGSCNGLLGLYTKTSTIKIANILTGECLYLEKPTKNLRGDHFSSYNFAFHPVKKEYKITHFLGDCSEGCSHNNKEKFNIIQIYTLGDEEWKDIQAPEALSLNCVRNNGVVNVDGTMYWLTKDMIASKEHTVVSFNLGEETFAQIQLPAITEDGEHRGSRQYWTREIEGKVCVATARISTCQPRMLVGKLQIWTLDQKVEQRWSHKYNIYGSYHFILGPNFVHGDKFMTQYVNCNLYSHEFLGENFEIESSKMVKLLDFSPRRPDKVQSYICVKSLVRLDLYKKSDIVRRPKQKEDWELKKWEAWERELCNIEDTRRNINKIKHKLSVVIENIGRMYQSLQHEPYDIAQRLCTEFNRVLQYKPDGPNLPRPRRRLNWMEQKRDSERLMARSIEINERMKVIKRTQNNICSTIKSYMMEKSISIPGISFLER